MFRRLSTLLAVLVLGFATLGLSACNTVAGAGKDASALGHDVTRGSTATSDKISEKTGASQN